MSNIDPQLESYVSRIKSLETEKRERAEDIREVYSEAKNAGHDIPALRIVVKRALETDEKRNKRETAEQIAERMMMALGMLSDMPLGRAALERVTA
jgi:uncharacterized protein (UPF0335 family)